MTFYRVVLFCFLFFLFCFFLFFFFCLFVFLFFCFVFFLFFLQQYFESIHTSYYLIITVISFMFLILSNSMKISLKICKIALNQFRTTENNFDEIVNRHLLCHPLQKKIQCTVKLLFYNFYIKML